MAFFDRILVVFGVFILSTITAQAAPAELFKRLVGTLQCQVVKNGTLTITTASQSKFVLASPHETLYNSKNVVDNYVLISLPQFTIDYSAKYANFEFVACRASDATNPFMSWPQEKGGAYYGHLSLSSNAFGTAASHNDEQGNPPLCATSLHINDDLGFDVVSAQPCSYSDDSGQFLQYWKYTPADDGKLQLLGFTAPDGPYPNSNHTVFSFQAGVSDANPAIQLKRSNHELEDAWTLRLN